MKRMFIFIFVFFSIFTNAQNICADSSVHIRYSTLNPNSDSVILHKQIKTADGGAIAIGHIKSATAYGHGIIMRFNQDGGLMWSKMIASNPFSGYIAFESIEEAQNGNMHIIARFNNGTHDGRPPFHLLVFSPNGNVINQKRIGVSNSINLNNKFVRTSLILKYGTDSLLYIFSGQTNAFTENQLFLMTADNSGAIGSSTIINAQPSGGWDAPVFRNGKLNGKDLILYGSSGFIGQCVNGSSNGPAFFSIKIDMTTKSVIANKAYCAPANSPFNAAYQTPHDFFSSGSYDNTFFLTNGNVIMTRSYLGVESNAAGVTNKLFSISTFDSSFNHLHSEYIVTGNIMTEKIIQELVIDSLGVRQFSFYDFNNKFLYYALADANNLPFLQKKIGLPSSKQYTHFTRNNIIENGYLVSFTILSYNNNSTHIDKFKILAKDTAQSCFGTDTAFLNFIPAQVTTINWQGQFSSEPGMVEEQAISFFSANYPFQRSIICNIINKCDTIKLNAPDTVCDITQPVIITAHKNPLCNGKVNFVFDTSQVQSFIQLNDTTLSLRFNKSYKGKIFAQPAACDQLKDSIEIIVNALQLPIDMGKDTLYCPGKNYILSAYNPNFKTYQWQDGSADSIHVASQPGIYYVNATDLCGRIYTDTIQIKNSNYFLSAGDDTSVCKFQSISLQASAGFSNYTWTPSYRISNVSGKTVNVYPDVTTAYAVSTDLFPGCTLKDTVLVSVKECGQQFFVPNAFTPNKDGKNDYFKPIIIGALDKYEFSIYNRWGQRVFLSGDKNIGWDGTIKGANQNGNVFVWICKYQFYNQQPETKKGTVMLIR